MRAWLDLFEGAVPQPTLRNMQDAIEHADVYGDAGWTVKDFAVTYLGLLNVEDIGQYDDLSSWVEAHEPDDLDGFRDGYFADGPEMAAHYPPIIVITAPDVESGSSHHLSTGKASGHCITQIGDGRGRVNFANAHDLPLHVYHMVHRECGDA